MKKYKEPTVIVKTVLILVFMTATLTNFAQTNTSPLPAGTTKIGGHLKAGATNEVWTDATSLYFNYQGNAAATHFWNLGGSAGKSIMSLLKNGNVGIGISNPNATLQIGDSDGSGSPSSEIEIKRLSLAPVTHSGSDWFFTTRDNDPYANLDIGYSNNKTLTLRHDGNVGIGTSNPQSKLAVNGLITTKEVQVTLDGWSDFVFEDDYKLKDLEEVESFINDNKHLPDVPSEKEVLENGIQLGEMDAKLLQKIEELTLYMIEQNKKSENLLKRVNSLEVENKQLKAEINTIKAQ